MDSGFSAASDGGQGVVCLRALLRGEAIKEDPAAAERAVAELIDTLRGPLFRYCAGLVRCAGKDAAEAEALALTAWNQALRHLADPQNDRIPDAEYLWRLLRNEAQCALLATTAGQAALAAIAAAAAAQEEMAGLGRTLQRRLKNPACPPRRHDLTRSLSPRWAAQPGT